MKVRTTLGTFDLADPNAKQKMRLVVSTHPTHWNRVRLELQPEGAKPVFVDVEAGPLMRAIQYATKDRVTADH